MRYRLVFVLAFAALSAVCAGSVGSHDGGSAVSRVAVDHVPIAVQSLDDARTTYERLGFRLKPGRLHANGLVNAFVKFREGDYLELISPQRGATDDLSARYVAQLDSGEGGAFLALRADSLPRVARRLRATGIAVRVETHRGAFTTLAFEHPSLSWLFLIEYLAPAIDPPELLDHPNTALGIETVWLRHSRYAALQTVESLDDVAAVREAPNEPAVSSPAPIAGITIRVRNANAAKKAILNGSGLDFPLRSGPRGLLLLVPAEHAHGVWIELLEPRTEVETEAA